MNSLEVPRLSLLCSEDESLQTRHELAVQRPVLGNGERSLALSTSSGCHQGRG